MSTFYEKINFYINSAKEKDREELCMFYVIKSMEKLEKLETFSLNALILIHDLQIHIKNHPILKSKLEDVNKQNNEQSIILNDNWKKIELIQSRIYDLKILHIRAVILDLVSTDYFLDNQRFYKPEDWIMDVIKEIENSFNELLKDNLFLFNRKMLREFELIFIAQNKKFGYAGNILLLNFIKYEQWVLSIIQYDFTSFFEIFYLHFEDSRAESKKVLLEMLDELQ